MIRRLTHGLRFKSFRFSIGAGPCPACAWGLAPPFAAFLRKTLHASSGIPSAAGKALFPLPFPKLGVFEWLPPRTSSRKRKRIEFDRAFHVVVCALNFLHADCSFVPMDLMLRVPSGQQACALGNLRSLLKAFGNPGGSFSVPQSGRRSINLLSSLADLSRFITVHGLTSDPYHRGFAGVDQCEPRSDVVEVGTFEPDLSRAEPKSLSLTERWTLPGWSWQALPTGIRCLTLEMCFPFLF